MARKKRAERFGVNVDRVYMAKFRITDSLEEEVRRLKKETL